ncbi:AI-2E family transporter [Hominifimenecus sp. rT4P-3]|uniref:AI-2E family transporter n=1 Tax=Hominifimenecus sp. rT4P-3 TaxID=3242979 RepID=UPI003DA6469B
MKFRLDKKYIHWGITAFFVVAASIIFYLILSQLQSMKAFLAMLIGVLKPVIYGLIFAYLMDPLLGFFENHWFLFWGHKVFPDKDKKARSMARALGVAASLLFVILIVVVLLWMVLPKLYDSLEMLARNLSTYLSSGEELIINTFPDGSEAESIALNLYNSMSNYATKWLSGESLGDLSSIVISISSGIYSVLKEILNMCIGLIVAVYVLMSKEKFAAQVKKILYSIFSVKNVNAVLRDLHDANRIFSGFISGKILDSAIIGVICFISLTILNMPYKELVSVIVGVTNVIPFFGPFIGAIPSAFLILLIDPVKCLVFLVFVLILQQFDGNILGPKILGESTGLGSFWVICAILVGGGLFGFVGMLFGVPVFAVIYMMVKRWVERSLQKKGIPPQTSEFKNIVCIDSETEKPVYRESLEELEEELVQAKKQRAWKKKK